jgi:hypothetical protein
LEECDKELLEFDDDDFDVTQNYLFIYFAFFFLLA